MKDTVERCFIAGYACVTDALGRARRNRFRELNAVDREVVAGELEAANEALLVALVQLPDWASRSEKQFWWHLEKLARRFKPKLPDPGCLECLLRNAHANLVWAAQAAEEDGGPTDLIEEVDHALCHLDRVTLVVAPDRFREQLAACDDPERRVQVAALAEHVELKLDESRALARPGVLRK